MISAIELFQISLLTQLREAKLHDYQVILYIRFQLADHCFIKTSHNPIPTIMWLPQHMDPHLVSREILTALVLTIETWSKFTSQIFSFRLLNT